MIKTQPTNKEIIPQKIQEAIKTIVEETTTKKTPVINSIVLPKTDFKNKEKPKIVVFTGINYSQKEFTSEIQLKRQIFNSDFYLTIGLEAPIKNLSTKNIKAKIGISWLK